MRKTALIIFFTSFALCLILIICACSSKSASSDSPVQTVSPTSVSTPTPTPFIEVEMGRGEVVSFDGKDFPDLYTKDDTAYVKLTDILGAMECDYEFNEDAYEYTFNWRKSDMTVGTGTFSSRAIPCDGGKDLYVPVFEFCDTMNIGYLDDTEFSHLYITPAAGDWELPQGYNVPVMMYHGVGHGSDEADLFVKPEKMEEQIVYLLENGYTPIWFEDLWHVEDFEKPIILTFDDGWKNTYDYLFPLLKKYNVKATTCIIAEEIAKPAGSHLKPEQLHEMYDSGLMKFESHTMSHCYLSTLIPAAQDSECIDSLYAITREFGYQPIVLCYPYGDYNSYTKELVNEYYRFGVQMCNGLKCYNTSDDNASVCRYYPERKTDLGEYISWLKLAFPDD